MANPDYIYIGLYNPATFGKLFSEKFAGHRLYNKNSLPGLTVLLDLIGRDPNVADVQWGAYMLATVMWETAVLTTEWVQVKDRKGRPVLDKHRRPVVVRRKKWLPGSPVDEVGHGKGRAYHEPVKVAELGDGSVRVTEQDGDQWTISSSGVVKPPLGAKPKVGGLKPGTVDGATAVKDYEADQGTPNAYFGRGYVQLTWWYNYASSGIAIEKGLDLLKDPELVKDPAVSYALMSHGMRTGAGFANGHRLSDYLSGTKRNYPDARKMVNPKDYKSYEPIAAIAETFEAILLASRVAPTLKSALESAER